MPVKIVIADDHAAVRRSLHLLITEDPDFELVGEAADGLDTIRKVHALSPDLLLMDIKMPQMNGLEVLQYLRNERNPVQIILLSNHSEPLYVQAAVRLGVNGFVAKSSGLEILMDAIHTVRTGGAFIDPKIV